MPNTYLTTKIDEKDKVKALGARFDWTQRAWFVPEGVDLEPFRAWLTPDEAASTSLVRTVGPDQVGGLVLQETSAVAVQRRGMSLSQLMLGVTKAVASAYHAGVWTTVEVVKADARSGNVYLELAERVDGRVVAQARGTIWAREARRIVPAFERATGVVLGGGIKLLVRAKPTAHAIYGLSVAIEEIDPDYTLGDLDAKKREIRARLQREGIFSQNKSLAPPWDYRLVVVVAPEGAAGLGDFQAESVRLARHGICEFLYAHSRFQGEGAATEIRETLLRSMDELARRKQPLPDAVAIIRGGGAVNDLAWLNDYQLARCICELEVPVLTGIGHERDSTVLDEVAHTKFDTPSKVIAGIEQLIVKRVQEAKASFDEIVQLASRSVQTSIRAVDGMDAAVRTGSTRYVALARQRTDEMMSKVRVGALRSVRQASEATREEMFEIRTGASEAIAVAKREVPAMAAKITGVLDRAVVTARAGVDQAVGFVMERVRTDLGRASESVNRGVADIANESRRAMGEAKERSEAMMREIAGQGPAKTLGRGFALVRNATGRTVTSVNDSVIGDEIKIELRDGVMSAQMKNVTGKGETR